MAEPIIILEDAKFIWNQDDIKTCIDLHEAGKNVFQIAKRMNENTDDIALLIIHLGQKGKIRGNKNGVR